MIIITFEDVILPNALALHFLFLFSDPCHFLSARIALQHFVVAFNNSSKHNKQAKSGPGELLAAPMHLGGSDVNAATNCLANH